MKACRISISGIFVAILFATMQVSRAQNSSHSPVAATSAESSAPPPPQTVRTASLTSGQNLALGHLLASQTALKATLPFLKKALNDNGGGFIEKATTEVNLALADTDKAIAYVNAHPEVNTVQPGVAPEADFGKIRPTNVPPYAQSSGHVKYPFLPNMVKAVESLNTALRAFMNAPDRPDTSQFIGSIGGYRNIIAGDIMKASSDVISALDNAHNQNPESDLSP